MKLNTKIINTILFMRDYHGLRGKKDLNLINAVMIGGSTTDERYKPEEFTITSILNDKLKDGIDLIYC